MRLALVVIVALVTAMVAVIDLGGHN